MLPTKGYFQDIECPYFDNACGRPYCHFRHRKKQLDLVDESSNEETPSVEVPTYKPTPKSELAVSRSHIPISYVPDLLYRAEKPLRTLTAPKPTFMIKPTYKPTPISLLTSAGKNDTGCDSVDKIKECMANTKYSPQAENVPQFEYKPTALEDKIINENLEKHEYKPTGENTNNIEYNPTALEDINEHNSSDVYKPTSDNTPSIDYKPSAYLLESSNINFENLDTEFDMIDEIISMSDKPKNPNIELNENNVGKYDVETNTNKLEKNEESSRDPKLSHKSKHTKSSSKKTDNHKKTLESKTDEKHHKSSKKHDAKQKTSSSKNSSLGEDKSSKGSDKKSSSRERDRKKEKSSKEKVEGRSKDREKSKDKERHKDVSKSKEKSKDKESSTKKRENEDSKKVKDKGKNEKEKVHKHDKKGNSREKDKSKHSKHEEKSRHKSSDKSKSKDAEKVISEKQSKEKIKYTLECFESEDDTFPINDNSDIDIDIDIDIDEDETMRECYRIFNEYKPEEEIVESEDKSIEYKDEAMEEQISSKKRVAHSNAPSTSAKFQQPQPKSVPTPGQTLANRFKLIREMQANNEEKLISNEVQRVVKRPAPTPSLLEAAKKHKIRRSIVPPKPTPSLVDDIISGNKAKAAPKKIAPVTNVLNIQRAKAQLVELNKKRAAEQMSKTIAQTSKAGKRQAHVPEYSLDDIPDVFDVDKSKLPVNVRTRYLTMLADECCKLYLSQADAYKRALEEEYSCYQKCKVLVTYRNSAMLAVNRIRKEVHEREQNDLGLLGSGESSSKTKDNSEKNAMYDQIHKYVLTDEELDIHGYPKESAIAGKAVIKNRRSLPPIRLPKNQKKCSRCSKIYLVDDDGGVIYEEECLYHPLRKRTIRGEQIYLCCKSSDDSGCATSHTHVSEMTPEAELEGFQTTMPPDGENDPRSTAIYALDCEMCYTTKGLELTRVTIVDTNCRTVYESLVKPLNEIIDYNTRFSGITKSQMDRINTGILQVQANILHLCNSRTILIGHSLESDMKALKIVHGTVVDTSVLFPHKMGLPHKKALKTLACDYLKKIIQNDVSGHDSAEDAITCMELVKWRVKEDTKFKFK